MRKKSLMLTSSLLIAVFLSTVAMATGGHGHKKAEKVGILLVAFGSSEASAQMSFENLAKKTKPPIPTYRCAGPTLQPSSVESWPSRAGNSITLKSP